MFESYYKSVKYLESLSNLPIVGDYMIDRNHPEIYLKRMRYFLNLLGNPDKDFKFIHITGTSGKGSVTNMLHEILFASGKKVGSFTSPYVVTSIEKIKVQDKYISPDDFVDIVDYLKPFIDRSYLEGPYGRPSYFEIFLAIALLYFRRQKCEWVVLEVGLGGRYDATNVIEKPLIAAITNIDYDHTEVLGRTLEKIAYDKAGIIKPGSVFFTTEQRKQILQIFDSISREKNVQVHNLSFQNDYQEYNKELARAVAVHLKIEDKYIDKGLRKARLPCRFEIVQNNPTVILDGAHNRSKMGSTIYNLDKVKYNKLFLLISISDSKDHESILEQIIPKADHILFTRFQNPNRKCAHPKELFEKSKQYVKKSSEARMYLDPEAALADALKLAKSDDLVLITGSFFLAGELRKIWYPEDQILRQRKSF